MWKFIFLCILIGQVLCQSQELRLPVKPQTQERLSEALQKLSDELQYFRTFFENRVNLFRRISIVQEYLQKVSDQVSQYDNVLIGQQNNIEGCKNIIVGSFNTIKGSNNYVFIQKYNGRANGDLLLGKWRIDIQNKNLVLINPSSAISFINEEFNRKYLRYVTKNNVGFGYGTNVGENVVILMKENQESDNFDANKRITYDPTGITYRVNNQFQYGFDPSPLVQTNVNNFAQQKKQISSFSSLGEIHQEFSNQPLGPQIKHLDSTSHVLILNMPFPPSMTYIQPDILAVKSTEFLNEMQKNIFSSTQATRQIPQPDSFIITGPTITPESQPHPNLPSVQKIQGLNILYKNQNSLNHISNKNLAIDNFKQNLRSQVYSINNDPPAQKNDQNLQIFRPISFIDGPVQQIFLSSNSQQNPQINLSLLKMDKTDN